VSTPSRPTDQPVSGRQRYRRGRRQCSRGPLHPTPASRVSASICTGRSVPPNAPIAISTAMSAMPASTSRPMSRLSSRDRGDAGLSGPQGGHQHVLWRRHAVADGPTRSPPFSMRCATAWVVPEGSRSRWRPTRRVSRQAGSAATAQAGVNRVSMGVQALNDPDLKRLGRLHDRAEALKAIGLAREIFPRMSFDLIYARPDQTPGGLGSGTQGSHFAGRRPSVALPADDRGRHAVLRICTRRAS
jgi:hypothetical protein